MQFTTTEEINKQKHKQQIENTYKQTYPQLIDRHVYFVRTPLSVCEYIDNKYTEGIINCDDTDGILLVYDEKDTIEKEKLIFRSLAYSIDDGGFTLKSEYRIEENTLQTLIDEQQNNKDLIFQDITANLPSFASENIENKIVDFGEKIISTTLCLWPVLLLASCIICYIRLCQLYPDNADARFHFSVFFICINAITSFFCSMAATGLILIKRYGRKQKQNWSEYTHLVKTLNVSETYTAYTEPEKRTWMYADDDPFKGLMKYILSQFPLLKLVNDHFKFKQETDK